MPWQANRSNLPSMKIATGKVVDGKVVLEGVALEEAQRRHRDVVEGRAQPVPGERVFENLRARLKR